MPFEQGAHAAEPIDNGGSIERHGVRRQYTYGLGAHRPTARVCRCYTGCHLGWGRESRLRG
jgi:hypothetical protein